SCTGAPAAVAAVCVPWPSWSRGDLNSLVSLMGPDEAENYVRDGRTTPSCGCSPDARRVDLETIGRTTPPRAFLSFQARLEPIIGAAPHRLVFGTGKKRKSSTPSAAATSFPIGSAAAAAAASFPNGGGCDGGSLLPNGYG